MSILVTGGTGYIGSHTVVELLNSGYDPIIVDNLCNSSKEVLNRIKLITGKDVKFYEIDCCDQEKLKEVFKENNIESVIHFAGLKAVGESVLKPLEYYRNNIDATLSLLFCMKEYKCKNIIFSSSATVYGVPESVPLYEGDKVTHATNPYGETKVMIERILSDYVFIDNSFNCILLRYFNPIGAHSSGLIGEYPDGIPNNLMPYITQVAVGTRKELSVFGNDYDTIDGTGVRDYIHVVDLAKGHVASLNKILEEPGLVVYNLGTGRGTSVLELVHAFENANGLKIPYVMKGRRPGDIDSSYANCSKAEKELHWKSIYTIEDACKDSWNWQSHNPKGYDK